MKKLLTLMLALILLLSLIPAARADVIWIPEDLFLEQHMAECIRTDRAFRALTDTPVYESPQSDRVVWTLAEGESVWIYYTYTDAEGNRWGNCEQSIGAETGWIPLAYTELVYDYISFEEDYGHLFETPEETLTLDSGFDGQEIRFWEYPGSESGYTGTVNGEYLPSFGYLYTDAGGRQWGYIGYHMGWRNVWVCLSDPTADFAALYPEGAPLVEVTEPGETDPTLPAEPIVPQNAPGTVALRLGVSVAVVLCVAVTIALLVRMQKKKNG